MTCEQHCATDSRSKYASAFDNVLDTRMSQPWNSELGKEVLLQHIRLLVPWYVNSVSSNLKRLWASPP